MSSNNGNTQTNDAGTSSSNNESERANNTYASSANNGSTQANRDSVMSNVAEDFQSVLTEAEERQLQRSGDSSRARRGL
ncbi:hypothetical protein KCU85_g2880, partial [Aureobasidium melanogenum]